MSEAPKVTVLMTVFNGMPYLPQAIDSILNQTYTEFEFLIVDDCSTDESVVYIQSLEDSCIRLVINSENIGQTKSLNKGLELVQTEYVMRMDISDLNRLQLQYDLLDIYPEIGLVGSDIFKIDKDGKEITVMSRAESHFAILWE